MCWVLRRWPLNFDLWTLNVEAWTWNLQLEALRTLWGLRMEVSCSTFEFWWSRFEVRGSRVWRLSFEFRGLRFRTARRVKHVEHSQAAAAFNYLFRFQVSGFLDLIKFKHLTWTSTRRWASQGHSRMRSLPSPVVVCNLWLRSTLLRLSTHQSKCVVYDWQQPQGSRPSGCSSVRLDAWELDSEVALCEHAQHV